MGLVFLAAWLSPLLVWAVLAEYGRHKWRKAALVMQDAAVRMAELGKMQAEIIEMQEATIRDQIVTGLSQEQIRERYGDEVADRYPFKANT